METRCEGCGAVGRRGYMLTAPDGNRYCPKCALKVVAEDPAMNPAAASAVILRVIEMLDRAHAWPRW